MAPRRAAALRVMLVTYPLTTVLLGVLAVTAGGPVHPGAALYPATTVILAIIVLREQ